LDRDRDAAERMDLFLAHHIGLPQVAGLDHRHRSVPNPRLESLFRLVPSRAALRGPRTTDYGPRVRLETHPTALRFARASSSLRSRRARGRAHGHPGLTAL